MEQIRRPTKNSIILNELSRHARIPESDQLGGVMPNRQLRDISDRRGLGSRPGRRFVQNIHGGFGPRVLARIAVGPWADIVGPLPPGIDGYAPFYKAGCRIYRRRTCGLFRKASPEQDSTDDG